MKGFKILYVEDEPSLDEIEQLFGDYDLTLPSDPEESNGKPTRKIAAGSAMPERKTRGCPIKNIPQIFEKTPIDFACNVVEALKLLEKNAEDYLLFIVDRRLDNHTESDEKTEIRKIWPEFSDYKSHDGRNYEGDVLLEYLCIKKQMIPECKVRFKFYTSDLVTLSTNIMILKK